MSQTGTDDFDFGDDPEDEPTESDNTQSDGDERVTQIPSHQLKQLRKNAAKASANASAAKELALFKAGIDTDSATGKMFLKSYDGELSKEAIIEAGKDIQGLFKESSTQSDDTTNSGNEGGEVEPGSEEGSTQERGALQTDSVPDDGRGRDVKADALKRAQEANLKGATEEETLGSFIGDLAAGYGEGDRSVVAKANEG